MRAENWFGYARISLSRHDLDLQLGALAEAGVAESQTFVDAVPGVTAGREGLSDLLSCVAAGDTVFVVGHDRLGRSLVETLDVAHALHDNGVAIRSLEHPGSERSSSLSAEQLSELVLDATRGKRRVWGLERSRHWRGLILPG